MKDIPLFGFRFVGRQVLQEGGCIYIRISIIMSCDLIFFLNDRDIFSKKCEGH